ncbi:MAG: putative metal-dependent hydrolase [Verrucomicrobia bacterium]|nr:putative metal-dependent hydrolase [Cytophagales bacterium]
MSEHDLYQLRYPIGKFIKPDHITHEHVQAWISDINNLPLQIRVAVEKLSEEQLETPYRPEGWTIRQVVHHLADSHINAFMRFKLALSEENPTIKPYFENLWAEMPDDKNAPVVFSMQLLEGLHQRWVWLMQGLAVADWQKTYFHPEQQRSFTLAQAAGTYAWHGHHHLAHIAGIVYK